MKTLAIWAPNDYLKDQLFNEASNLNRDNCLAAFRLLKKKLENEGGQCHTYDVYRSQGHIPVAVLFLDMPSLPLQKTLKDWYGKVRSYLLLQECEVIRPDNWDLNNHSDFNKIFTWHDEFIDNKKYFKVNFSFDFLNIPTQKDLSTKNKPCTLIAGHKKSSHPLELYSHRQEAIRWFEKNHLTEFDLYGQGWDEYRFEGKKISRVLNRIKLLTRYLAPEFPSYIGKVEVKYNILSSYKFAICYENAQNIPGYITEKIFDCFFASCVPIYWGANNISEHIPNDCYIDKRNFPSYEDLYNFITNINMSTYLHYLISIDNFLKSQKAYQFTCDHFSNTIIREIYHNK